MLAGVSQGMKVSSHFMICTFINFSPSEKRSYEHLATHCCYLTTGDKCKSVTHSSKVRGLVDNSCALFLLDVVIHHYLECSLLCTLESNRKNFTQWKRNRGEETEDKQSRSTEAFLHTLRVYVSICVFNHIIFY